ncbi:hypothetical protein ELH68_11880 [Rhizobium ruizarguesonis]|jgi:hypothetical protein|nr:hypothetical protein ELH68_11880 [Rhizobium ruizarguesonis]TBA07582.1 hypothetical protein ELH64_10440 [Rhizobium ruizarguesonis]TBA45570.1 hypothetical protein ELH62_10285 [Rhizobium ruizarguesonis]TBC35451.1 hypothetical protein ELH33_10245 [Rhizobium ruizarguesonis]
MRRPVRVLLAESALTEDLITPAMLIQIELAIASTRDDRGCLDLLEIEAKRMTLTAAEIDAAKRGASFDAITNIAVKFALADYADDAAGITATKEKLATFGVAAIAPHLHALVQGLKLPASI